MASLWPSFALLTDMVPLKPHVTQPNRCYWSWCKVFLPGPAKQWIYPAHLVTPDWVPKADQDLVGLTIVVGKRNASDCLTLSGACSIHGRQWLFLHCLERHVRNVGAV
jgi:hypothetical protein